MKEPESYADWMSRAITNKGWRVVYAIFDEMTEEEYKECLTELIADESHGDEHSSQNPS